MRRTLYLILLFALTFILGCACMKSKCSAKKEKDIPVSQVPKAAMEAAQNAAKGVNLTEASVEEEKGQTVYTLEGNAEGKEYNIEVTADGKVLEVKQEAEDKDEQHEKSNKKK
jgi:outer membrane lipoprotein-sorting protein